MNHPGGESSVGVKTFFSKGVNHPGVNAKMGETSANLSNCWGGGNAIVIMQVCFQSHMKTRGAKDFSNMLRESGLLGGALAPPKQNLKWRPCS